MSQRAINFTVLIFLCLFVVSPLVVAAIRFC